jgi:hypothetical protein
VRGLGGQADAFTQHGMRMDGAADVDDVRVKLHLVPSQSMTGYGLCQTPEVHRQPLPMRYRTERDNGKQVVSTTSAVMTLRGKHA